MSKYSEKKERQLRERLAAEKAGNKNTGNTSYPTPSDMLPDPTPEIAVNTAPLTVPPAESDMKREARRKMLFAVRNKIGEAARLLDEARGELKVIAKETPDKEEKDFLCVAKDRCVSAWGRARGALDYVHLD